MQSCWCHCCSNTFRRKDVISCKRNRICIHWIIRLFFVRFFFTYSRLNCLNPEKELLCISVIELWLRILQKKFHSNKNIQELILYLLKRPQPRNQNSNYFAWCATSLVQAFLPYVTLYLHIIALILRNLKTSKMSRWGQTGKYNILQETKWIWRISGLIYVLEMSNTISVGMENISPSQQARNLGVIFDETMSFSPHVNTIVKGALYHIRNISKIRKYISKVNSNSQFC